MYYRWLDVLLPIATGLAFALFISLVIGTPIPFVTVLFCSVGALGIGWGIYRVMRMRRERDQ